LTLVIDGLGGILVGDEAVTRYAPSGALDTGFGEGGTVGIGQYPAATILAAPDGSAVVFGPTGASYAGRRIGPDGSRDRSFGRRVDGNAFVSIAPAYDLSGYPLSSAASGGGRIILAGVAGRQGSPVRADGFVAAFTRAGRLAGRFGDRGWRAVDTGGFDVLTGLAALPGGRILVAGWRSRIAGAAPDGILLAMLRADGGLARAFGRRGVVVTRRSAPRGVAPAEALAVDATHALVTGSTGGDFLAVRYLLGP
jgi:hypothetical protein